MNSQHRAMDMPDRIHNWLDSHLSVARFYGGIDVQGVRYVISEDEPGQPLVRADVLRAEQLTRQLADKAARKKAAEQFSDDQQELL